MAIFVFALALLLAIIGGIGLFASIDLLPTDIGILYGVCGVIALSAACIVAAIGGLIVRVDKIGARVRRALMAEDEPPSFIDERPVGALAPQAVPATEPELAVEKAAVAEPIAEDPEEPVNEYRTGHLPTIEEIEETIAHPEPAPRLIGRYSAGGANYAIFSDGSVEAEMAEGQYNFSSMSDFRAFLEDRRGQV